jgi:hypothetical protein
MRGSTRYDDNALPAGYNPVSTARTSRGDEASRRSRRPRRSSSSTSESSPRIRHEITAVPNPAAPGGVAPHVVTHVHLPPPRRNRRHRSASREPPPVASRPAYGRRRSRSYDDSYRGRTTVINVPPPPIASNSGYMYGQQQPLPPLRPLPSGPEFGYGRPAAASSGYGGAAPFVPPRPTSITVMQPSGLGQSPTMAGSASGSSYPSSRRRARSNAYPPSSASPMSAYGSASQMGRSGQYSQYGGNHSTAPNITVMSPSASSGPYSAGGYGPSASQMYSSQRGYGSPMVRVFGFFSPVRLTLMLTLMLPTGFYRCTSHHQRPIKRGYDGTTANDGRLSACSRHVHERGALRYERDEYGRQPI